MSTAPRAGRNCCCQRSIGSKEVAFAGDTVFAKPQTYKSVEERKANPPSGQGRPEAQGCLGDPPGGEAKLQAASTLQELSLPGSELEGARRVMARIEFRFGECRPSVRELGNIALHRV